MTCAKKTANPPGRRVKLFRHGRNQAVRIPRELELPGEDAIMRNEGDHLILEPSAHPSLLGVLARLMPIEEDFPPIGETAAGTLRVVSSLFLLDTAVLSDLGAILRVASGSELPRVGENAITSVVVTAELEPPAGGAVAEGPARIRHIASAKKFCL